MERGGWGTRNCSKHVGQAVQKMSKPVMLKLLGKRDGGRGIMFLKELIYGWLKYSQHIINLDHLP